MPTAKVNGTTISYEERGRGEQAVVFSAPLLWSRRVFEAQLDVLADDYRCIAYDHRGQGRSESPDERAHEIESCYLDALELVEQLGATPCHFIGLSMGGFIGVRLAARHPEFVRSLCMMATPTDREPEEHLAKYRVLNSIARYVGIGVVARRVMPLMFGDSFLSDASRTAERKRWKAELRSNRRTIHRAVTGVIEREACIEQLDRIRCPVLVLHGDEDRVLSRERAMASTRSIDDARFVPIERAGHLITVENPRAVNAAVLGFLREVDAGSREHAGSGESA